MAASVRSAWVKRRRRRWREVERSAGVMVVILGGGQGGTSTCGEGEVRMEL